MDYQDKHRRQVSRCLECGTNISYGRKDSNGRLIDMCGLQTLYRSEADYGRSNLTHLTDIYNEGKYDEVMTKIEGYNDRLEEFYVLYGIKENTAENE